MRIQKVENVNKCLEFIRLRGVNLTNIGAEGEKRPANTRRDLSLYLAVHFLCLCVKSV